jgi:hypothetical protein
MKKSARKNALKSKPRSSWRRSLGVRGEALMNQGSCGYLGLEIHCV